MSHSEPFKPSSAIENGGLPPKRMLAITSCSVKVAIRALRFQVADDKFGAISLLPCQKIKNIPSPIFRKEILQKENISKSGAERLGYSANKGIFKAKEHTFLMNTEHNCAEV